jgi:hypothetical protein
MNGRTSEGSTVRRNRAAGDQIDEERTVAAQPRPPAALTPAPSREEEARLIEERLAALVASRKADAVPTVVAPAPAPAWSAPAPTPWPAPLPTSTPAAAPTTNESAPDPDVPGTRHSGRLLGNLLVTRGFVLESELQYALSLQAQSGSPIGQILVQLGLIKETDLVELLAEQRRMQVMDPSKVVCDAPLLARLPKADAHRLGALPVRLADGQIDVVIADPSNGNAIAELMNLLGGRLRLFLATRGAIDDAIERVYD